MKRILLITFGFITLSLGVIGIILPLLPTTPFLLLSATCFLKSSSRLYEWLINHKYLGLYIKSYMEYRAITIQTKVLAISMICVVMTVTIIFFIDILWLRIFLAFTGIGVSTYLLSMKTLTDDLIRKSKIS